ncbi:MAG TPA: hypothetical protein VG652_05410 [Gaiellaceae bacterium]|nr:hypothetical protein [Gaiellaceae bacterium]
MRSLRALVRPPASPVPDASPQPQQRSIRWHYLALFALAAAAIVVLAYEAPLTYDEAYNRLVYGNLGVTKILETYNAPNNHLPFTVLQSWIPNRLLRWDPWTIRIVGVAFGIAMVAELIGVAAARRSTPLLGLFIVAGSPILVTYLFVARGYTFSAVLFGVAAALPVLLARRDPVLGACLGGAVLAFATWPVPTNGFIAPGWIVAVLAIWGFRAAIVGTAVYATALTIMFAPVASQVRAQSKVHWNTPQRWWTWVGDLLAASSLLSVCLIFVGVLAIAAFVLQHRARPAAGFHALGASAQLAVIAFAMSGSWFVLIGAGHVFGLELPFVRSAVPALWVGVLAVVAGFPKGRLEVVAVALLVPGLILGGLMWTRAISDGDWARVSQTSRNDVLDGTTPATIRNLSSIHADRLVCSGYDSYVCDLVAPSLVSSGVTSVGVANEPVSTMGCAIGSHKPAQPFQVLVYRQSKQLGVLCH